MIPPFSLFHDTYVALTDIAIDYGFYLLLTGFPVSSAAVNVTVSYNFEYIP
jgi:hypothetical protein